MPLHPTFQAILVILCVVLHSNAAVVSWNKGAITGDHNVETTGALIEAANFGGSGVADVTVNSVNFPGVDFTNSENPTNLSGLTYNNAQSGNGTSTGGSIDTLTHFIAYESGKSTQTVTLTGLNPGTDYLIQFFIHHSNTSARANIIDDTNDNTVTVSHSGEYATGTFTADDTTQPLVFTNTTGGSQLWSGYQLRAIAAPDTAPTLPSSNIVDDAPSESVAVNTEIIFTISFSKDMDATSVGSADFGNAGSATVNIGTITEVSPGSFTISVTPTSTGTLQLAVLQDAYLSDSEGNLLNTSSAILDDTTLVVETTVTSSSITKVHVFLIGGQSNADGRASPTGLPTSPVNLQQAQEDVDLYEGGSLADLEPGSQFGPEITMGRRLADSLGTEDSTRVAIIKYAEGGTSLAIDWAPGGDATTSGDGPRYQTFQNTVTSGLAALASAYPEASIELNGMLWVQGERDAKRGYEDLYESNLTAFIEDVRATYSSELPFIISRLSINQTDIPSTELDIVRTAQSNVASADDLNRLIDTDTFGIKVDNLHFDASGQQNIGDAAAFQMLTFFPLRTQPILSFNQNGNVEVSLENTFPDFVYKLKTNPDLTPENWTVHESVTSSGSSILFTPVSIESQTREFYQIERSLP